MFSNVDNQQVDTSATIEEDQINTGTEAPEQPQDTTPELSDEYIANMSDEEFEAQEAKIQEQLEQANQSYEPEHQEESFEAQSPSANGESESSGNGTTLSQEDKDEIAHANATMSDADFRKFLTSKFRANNADVQVDNPEDIRRLMQMGMNYQKKLGKIRPHLGALKSLEQNGLLDNEKVSFFIDLMQHKKEAIAQLLKESEVDTYDLPDLEETPYEVPNYIPDEHRLEFEETVEELNTSDTGRQVLTGISDWDAESKAEIYNNPALLNQLNNHVSSGLYGKTVSILEREYALGKVPPNLSNIEAYNFVATNLLHTDPQFSQPSSQLQESVYQQPVQQQQVVGNNIQPNQLIHNQASAKYQAGIPSNQQPSQYASGNLDLTAIANLSDEELDQYGNFEDFLVKSNIRFK